MHDDLLIVTLDGSDSLVLSLARCMGLAVYVPNMKTFADGETNLFFSDPTIFEHKKIILVQSTAEHVNDTLMRLLFCIHELKNAGARSVIAVIPYFGYSRQEKSAIAGKPGFAHAVAKMIESSAIDQLVTVALHHPIIETFFTVPVHTISLTDFLVSHVAQNYNLSDCTLIAPDKGSGDRVRAIAQKLNTTKVVTLHKERYAADKTRFIKSAQVFAQTAILIDDIIDTGGTALQAAQLLREQGVAQIDGYFIHPVLSGEAVTLLEKSLLRNIFVTNTLAVPPQKLSSKIKIIDIGRVLADALTAFV